MRVCPYCGAHLDACEVCDCCKKAAPDGEDPEAARGSVTNIITDDGGNVK